MLGWTNERRQVAVRKLYNCCENVGGLLVAVGHNTLHEAICGCLQVPKNLVLIGGGVIGLEMGSVWARLGSKVTVVEFLDRVCPSMDQEITKAFTRVLKKQGLKFKFKTKVFVRLAKSGCPYRLAAGCLSEKIGFTFMIP